MYYCPIVLSSWRQEWAATWVQAGPKLEKIKKLCWLSWVRIGPKLEKKTKKLWERIIEFQINGKFQMLWDGNEGMSIIHGFSEKGFVGSLIKALREELYKNPKSEDGGEFNYL